MSGINTGKTVGAQASHAARKVVAIVITAAAVFGSALFAAPDRAKAQDSWANQVIADMRAQEAAQKRATLPKAAKLGGGSLVSTTPPKQITSREKPKPETRVASLGRSAPVERERPARKSLSGGSINWLASSGCLDSTLRSVLGAIAATFGQVTVNSTCRSKSHNARVGGAPRSKHLSGDAADFRVSGSTSAVYAYLRSNGNVGGLKHYGGGLFHIDNGDRRSW
jgi:Peptidase M15